MNDMRFNQPPRREERGEAKVPPSLPPQKKVLSPARILLIFGAIAAAVIIALAGWKSGFDFLRGPAAINDRSDSTAGSLQYSAVFLTNGQVYFGKIKKQTSDQIDLGEVFYLQSEKQSADAKVQQKEPAMTLVKLGQELHGPTNEIFINRSQVLFYENLRDDSKIVEAIKNSK